MTRAVIALGSNLGDRRAYLDQALDLLKAVPGVTLETRSAWCESLAHTLEGVNHSAPRYLNGVALLETDIDPHELLSHLHRIESALGRVRSETWADRTLDLDLVAYGDVIVDDEQLTLPHPRAHERVFVLAPWLSIDPHAVLPLKGPVAELIETLDPIEREALTEVTA